MKSKLENNENWKKAQPTLDEARKVEQSKLAGGPPINVSRDSNFISNKDIDMIGSK